MSAPETRRPKESLVGRMPVLLNEREYGTAGAHATCFAYAVATWCFLTGGYVADLVGAVQGVVCLVAGNMLGVFIAAMPFSFMCQRHGLEQMDACKPAFGQRGAQLLLVFFLINMLGWSGLILVMFGNGLRNIAEAVGYQPGGWIVGLGVVVGLGLSYWIAVRGVHLLKLANAIVTPGIALLVAFMFYMLLRNHGWEAIASAPPLDPGPKPTVNYVIAVELGVASGIAWWGGIGFLARNTRTRRNAVYPEILQLGMATGIVCSVALFSALAVQSDDPTEWMVPLGGVFFGVLALTFLGFANITSAAISISASGLALRHVPALRARPWWQVMVVAVVPCVPFVFWPHELYDLGDAFLAYNGTMYAPIAGVVFVDFFPLRRGRISVWSIFDDTPTGEYYYAWGFNWPALISVVFGQVVYLVLFDPISGETHDLFRFLPASLAACLVSAAVYWSAMRLRRRFVRAPEAGAARASAQLGAPNI